VKSSKRKKPTTPGTAADIWLYPGANTREIRELLNSGRHLKWGIKKKTEKKKDYNTIKQKNGLTGPPSGEKMAIWSHVSTRADRQTVRKE